MGTTISRSLIDKNIAEVGEDIKKYVQVRFDLYVYWQGLNIEIPFEDWISIIAEEVL